ncbi:putative transcription factor interactor and regulator CCHC(Zn) family [Helianthus debilis subsp. tardiflorus]
MSLLVLESYGSLVAGRIGNPLLTKEDYDQNDAEEMELMDIKWCLASVLRRAEKFKQITGRYDFRDANVSTLGFDKSKVTCFRCSEKGHFKRECTNREASGAQNPFGKNDYYRKAIYHQVAQQPYQQQSPQTTHGIEESKKAYLVNQDDERSSKGFSWDKYISAESKACLTDQDDERLPKGFSWDDYDPNRTSGHKAFVAQIKEDSVDDYYAEIMKEHLKYLAKRDANVRVTKKKVKKQDDRDDDNSYYAKRMKEHLKFLAERDKNDEDVRVIKKQVKEIPAFKIEKEADAEKVSETCENCATMKKHNNELIHNMNKLKESYDVLNKAMNQYNESSRKSSIITLRCVLSLNKNWKLRG